jgi:hypothetical protein
LGESKGYVFSYGQVREKGWLLINAGDAEAVRLSRIEVPHSFAKERYETGVRRMRPSDDLD